MGAPVGATLTLDGTAIACQQGLVVHGSAAEIAQASTRAVIRSLVACFPFNGIVAPILYLLLISRRGGARGPLPRRPVTREEPWRH